MNTEAKSLLPPYDGSKRYVGTLLIGANEARYQCEMVEGAILNDNLPALKETIANGWIVPESRTFMGSTLIELCLMRGAHKCAAHLLKQKWPAHSNAAEQKTPLAAIVPAAEPNDDPAPSQEKENGDAAIDTVSGDLFKNAAT